MRKIDGKIPTSYDEAKHKLLTLGGVRYGRATKISANTTLRASDGRDENDGSPDFVQVILHNTDVVTFHRDGTIQLNSGGYRTVTTKARINAALAGSGLRVVQRDFAWTVERIGGHRDPLDGIPFVDGMMIRETEQGNTFITFKK